MPPKKTKGTGAMGVSDSIMLMENALHSYYEKKALDKTQKSNSTSSLNTTKPVKLTAMNKSQLQKLKSSTQISSSTPSVNVSPSLIKFPSTLESSIQLQSSKPNNEALPKAHSSLAIINQTPTSNARKSFSQNLTPRANRSSGQNWTPLAPQSSGHQSRLINESSSNQDVSNNGFVLASNYESCLMKKLDFLIGTQNKIIEDLELLKVTSLENQRYIQECQENQGKIKENHGIIMDQLKGLLKKNRGKITGVPPVLPFKTVDDIEAFNSCDEATYDSVVDYFIYLGGMNIRDCLSSFFKDSLHLSSELLDKISYRGASGHFKLQGTNFDKACEEAASANKHFSTTESEFHSAMMNALKCVKESLRRKKKKNTGPSDGERPPKRNRVPPKRKRKRRLSKKKMEKTLTVRNTITQN
ncbi:hypothetical protein TKK_0013375 [Trichogramma kaykai]|uniref:DUF4806 domain-containing protein n=2 Tax=Trichogramma kaykai TaxID=54128 RepID=A0ABD2WJ51_9HYME